MVLNFESGTNIDKVLKKLRRDPLVVRADAVSRFPLDTDPEKKDNSVLADIVFTNPSWGHEIINSDAAHAVVEGHTYVGVLDRGIQPDHPELLDIQSDIYVGGNFHPNLSASMSGGSTFPGGLRAQFEYADEYATWIGEGDSDYCDDDGSGTIEMYAAGHGSHVSGILGRQVQNGVGSDGVCKTCPTFTLQYTIPEYSPPRCYSGMHYDGSPFESGPTATDATAYGGMIGLVDIGAQIVNFSSEDHEPADYCESSGGNQDTVHCLAVQHFVDRDSILVASAGNGARSPISFPASQPSVVGVSGLETDGGNITFWQGQNGFGSNFGTDQSDGPSFSAAAKEVYSTLHTGKKYSTVIGCDESTDGDNTNGYGYCTGTSMATPFITGVFGLARAANPLVPRNELIDVVKQATGSVQYDNELGWGTPDAKLAVESILGIVGNG